MGNLGIYNFGAWEFVKTGVATLDSTLNALLLYYFSRKATLKRKKILGIVSSAVFLMINLDG